MRDPLSVRSGHVLTLEFPYSNVCSTNGHGIKKNYLSFSLIFLKGLSKIAPLQAYNRLPRMTKKMK